MIKFSYSEYTLAPQGSLNAVSGDRSRHGALFKMQWPDRKTGYADLMPWPEFGDDSIHDQILKLGQGHISKLMEQTIWLGRKDAVMRAMGRNAFQGGPKVKNHFTVTDFSKCTDAHLSSAASSGFTTIKMKVGRDWAEELKWLIRVVRQYSFQVRLDFNSSSNFAVLERMISSLPAAMKHKLEYVEDPFPFELNSWTEASKLVPLAVDFEYANVPWKQDLKQVPFKFLILKPARQDVDLTIKQVEKYDLKLSVSSSMDHPIGVAHAMRVAADLKGRLGINMVDCGCLTTKLYMPNEFSTKIIIQGPYIMKIPGTGVGFDEVLQLQKWKPLQIHAGSQSR